MKKKYILSLFIAGLTCVTFMPEAHAFTQNNKQIAFATAVTLLAPYIYTCCTKADPQTRYSIDELLAGNNILKNLYYLYIDGFLGTPEKKEGFKMKNKEGSKLSIKPKAKREATGVIGNIHANINNFVKATPFFFFIWSLVNYEEIRNPRDILSIAKLLK